MIMNMGMRVVLILGIGLIIHGMAMGQRPDTAAGKTFLLIAPFTDSASPDLEAQLIPLNEIIEVAIRHSPYLKYDSALIEASEKDVVLAKRSWQHNLSAFANYSSGNQQFLTTGGDKDIQNNLINGYRYGVNLNLPLSEFTTRKIRIQQERAEMHALVHKKGQTEMELRKQVIIHYNNLIAAQRILKIKTVGRENALVLQQMAEKQFREGTTSLQDYATVSEITNDAEASYELAKSTFNSLYRQFEDLLGVQLTSLMRKQ